MKHVLVRAALAAALILPVSAQAHKMWIVPSTTVVSSDDAWVTVDAAVSNDLYYPDHFPAQLDQLVISAGSSPTPARHAARSTCRSRRRARTASRW